MEPIKKITSFTVDHTKLLEGMYISRKDGDITTFDLRTRKPNKGDYMDNLTMHSVEHMLATFLRNGELKDDIIYFGPMGCCTGFYLLVKNSEPEKVKEVLIKALKDTTEFNGEVFGASEKECGNYKMLSLKAAKTEAERYLKILENTNTFNY